MAKIELKHIDFFYSSDFIKAEKTGDLIHVSGKSVEEKFDIFLDKSTAIKFAKTLRTEINKM